MSKLPKPEIQEVVHDSSNSNHANSNNTSSSAHKRLAQMRGGEDASKDHEPEALDEEICPFEQGAAEEEESKSN